MLLSKLIMKAKQDPGLCPVDDLGNYMLGTKTVAFRCLVPRVEFKTALGARYIECGERLPTRVIQKTYRRSKKPS